LIEKAKAEYTKKNLPPSSKTEGGDSMFAHLLIELKLHPARRMLLLAPRYGSSELCALFSALLTLYEQSYGTRKTSDSIWRHI
jgi:hypothetical protein